MIFLYCSVDEKVICHCCLQLSNSFADMSEFLTSLCMLWLQKGVKTFSSTVNKNFPWRKILELGHHEFDHTRTPTDLKDKWKRICSKYGGRV